MGANQTSKMNWSFFFFFMAVLAYTGAAVLTRSGAGQPIIVTSPAAQIPAPAAPTTPALRLLPVPTPAAGGGAHVVATVQGTGAGGPGGVGVPVGDVILKRDHVPIGLGDNAAAGPGLGADADSFRLQYNHYPVDTYDWLRDTSYDALQSARGMLLWMGNKIQAIANQCKNIVHTCPMAVDATVSAVAVTTVYNYGPTFLNYALKNTQCYVDGSEDYRALLRLDNPHAPTSRYEEWGISYEGLEGCRTGTRPYQARIQEARHEKFLQERVEQERKNQEDSHKHTKASQHVCEELKDTCDATKEGADQRQAQGTNAGVHDEANILKPPEDQEAENRASYTKEQGHGKKDANKEPWLAEESTYDDLKTGAVEVQQILDLVVLWVPVVIYVIFGDNQEVLFAFSSLSLLFGILFFSGEHSSYYEDFDRRARAGELVERKDRNQFVALLFMMGVIKDLAILLGSLASFQIIGHVWAWVTLTYPASQLCSLSERRNKTDAKTC